MVNINIESVLQLPVMENHLILAGENGLSNIIHSITVHDNIPSPQDSDISTFKNDIYITSLFFGKDNPKFIIDFVKHINSLDASAIFIIDEFVNTIPDEAIAFCNENALPVILLDRKTPYSLIISSIMEYKIYVQQLKSIESNLRTLMSYNTPQSTKESIIKELNPNFSNHVQAIYCMKSEEFANADEKVPNIIGLINRLNQYPSCFAAEYRNGILIIISKKNRSTLDFSRIEEELIEVVNNAVLDYKFGISNILSLMELGTCISQAFMAANSDCFSNSDTARYKDLGISKLLIGAEGNPLFEDFYNETILPIKEYDQNNNTQLLQTMFVLAKNDMDFKKTSEAMFMHENTIRYRITKVKELLSYGVSDMDFFITVSMLYKIHILLCL